VYLGRNRKKKVDNGCISFGIVRLLLYFCGQEFNIIAHKKNISHIHHCNIICFLFGIAGLFVVVVTTRTAEDKGYCFAGSDEKDAKQTAYRANSIQAFQPFTFGRCVCG
jgi:hypothetical protein